MCDDGTLISASSVCDGIKDCYTNDDEEHCSNFTYLVPHSELCMKIMHRNLSDILQSCLELNISEISQMPCVNVSMKLSRLTLDFTVETSDVIIKDQKHSRNYCIYELDECGLIKGHPQGANLISCENHNCPDRYFKCPGFYCIPWRYVCNNRTDCPGGTDEVSKACNRTSCPGMYRCKDSVICLSLANFCDNFTDCYSQDDEIHCSKKAHNCPIYCSCLLFSMSCKNKERQIQWCYSGSKNHFKGSVSANENMIALRDMMSHCMFPKGVLVVDLALKSMPEKSE